MAVHYTPLLRFKKGELEALANIPDDLKVGVSPLIELTAETYRPVKGTATTPSLPPPAAFAEAIAQHWGAQPLYVQASSLTESAAQLRAIMKSGAALSLMLQPAARLGDGHAYLDAVAEAASDSLLGGAALRIRFEDVPDLKTRLANWHVDVGSTDLIIDLGGRAAFFFEIMSGVRAILANLYAGSEWSRVTLASTSMPADLSGRKPGLHRQTRYEWLLWEALREDVPFQLHYGDFATVAPTTTTPPGNARMPVNARYTLGDQFLLLKGVPQSGKAGIAMKAQFRGHAQAIAECAEREAVACWADGRIDAIAGQSENEKCGNRTKWAAYAVNRHVVLTTGMLS